MRIHISAALLFLSAFHAEAKDGVPLAHGIFVTDGYTCRNPPNVALFGYWGDSIGLGHDGCGLAKVRREGGRYSVKLDCESVQTQRHYTLDIGLEPDGPKRVLWTSKEFTSRYRWCGPSMDALWRN